MRGLPVTDEEFINAVARRAGVSTQQAESLTRATLSTLADRLSSGEADDVASQLPRSLKEAMIPSTPKAEPFDLEEFIDRVSRRAGVDAAKAEVGVRAVLTTLREAISKGEFEDMMAQLPLEFGQMIERASSQA
jgi:uncharacterized protein (DUF2267 family)